MREILFRGKCIGTKEWVYGYFFARPILEKYFIELGNEMWRVDPTTVGQYTGLQDMNGDKIFEGDIVKVYNFEIIKKDGKHIKKQPFNLEVLFFNGGFVFSTKEDIAREFGLNANEYAISKTDKNCFRIEVVGNIYDNTKLIEDGTPLADRFWNIK